MTYAIPILRRFTKVEGETVRWQNYLEGMRGQGGTYVFSNREDAIAFAAYANQEGAPALNNEALRVAGIPMPIERRMEKP